MVLLCIPSSNLSNFFFFPENANFFFGPEDVVIVTSCDTVNVEREWSSAISTYNGLRVAIGRKGAGPNAVLLTPWTSSHPTRSGALAELMNNSMKVVSTSSADCVSTWCCTLDRYNSRTGPSQVHSATGRQSRPGVQPPPGSRSGMGSWY